MSENKNESHKVLLARIDERTRILTDSINDLKIQLTHNYVTQEEFKGFKKEMNPVKQTVFGALSFIVIAVLATLIDSVVKK